MSVRFLFTGGLVLCAAALGAGPMTGKPRSGGGNLENVPTAAQAVPNPYAGNREAVRAGQKLYTRHCAGCHGVGARGNRAPSLNSERIRRATPGSLFWVLKNGELTSGMPSWSSLPDERLWQMVSFLHEWDSEAGAGPVAPR